MKGTLYSADYIKTNNGDFKLLELNTDTDFATAALVHFDWNPFIEELNSSSIDTVHVIYKKFQKELKDNFSESLESSSYSFTWEETVESPETIYPTDIQDSTSKFVLRMAYNEAAILDSEYCKNGITLYKLFSDESSSHDIIPHYVSSSNDEYVMDSLEKITNNHNIPDYALKKGVSIDGVHLDFYKLGSSSLSSSVRFDDMISSSYEDGDIITTYYDTSDTGSYSVSYRSCNILYGSNLDFINIATYKGTSWLELPSSIDYDNDILINKIKNKHRYEFATNWPKEYWKNQGGVSSEAILINVSGSSIMAKDTIVGDQYKSMNVEGLPDTDSAQIIESWYITGSTLPIASEVTSSQLVSKNSASVAYGVLSEISMSNDSSMFIGSSLPLLVYDVNEDKIRFEYASNIETGSFQLFDSSGSLVDIVENNITVFENEEVTYELNMESDDTFLIDNAGVYLIAHNPYYGGGGIPGTYETCFLAGTQISTITGDKNIEDILVGDSVLCWDVESETFTYSDVTETDSRHTVGDHLDGCRYVGYNETGVFKIFIDMDSDEGPNDLGIRFTPEHPFLTKEGWKALAPIPNQEPWATQQTEIKYLEVGDYVKYADGNWYKITSIEFEPMDGDVTVYNFTVNTHHNYVAGSTVVHNKF